MAGEDSLQLLRYDLSNQAKSISALVVELREQGEVLRDLETDKAVRALDRKNLDDRMARMEKRIDDLAAIGKWILLAFAASFITAAVSFIVKGGLFVGP